MTTRIIRRMAVEIDGAGDALVMIHGLGGTSNTFTPLMDPLAGRLQVVRPDLPGSGRSAADPPLSIAGFAEAVVAVAVALGIERAHVAGHSLGAIVCFHLALTQPGLVRSLALFGPFLAPPDAGRQALRERAARARSDGMQPIADAIVQGATAAETRARRPVAAALVREMVMRQPAEGYARSCEALAEAQGVDVAAIRCPTLLVTGDEDAIAPPGTARMLAERIAGARAVILPRCGHWTTIERPEECSVALREFYFRRT